MWNKGHGLHLNISALLQDTYGVQDHSILIKKPQHHIVKYTIKLGDETLLSTMSVFFPDLLTLQGARLTHVQRRNDGDPEDPHDEFYLQSTSREVGRQSDRNQIYTESSFIYDGTTKMSA